MSTNNSYEYRFKMDAYSPETIPLSRLAQYLGDLARMMGEFANVHLSHLEKGSTIPVLQIDPEAEPKVRERLRALRYDEGPAEARRAFKEINKRLVEDNANGILLDAKREKVINFPGRDAANQIEFPPFTQIDFFQGIPIKLGGEQDPVPIHLEDGEEKHIFLAPRRIAKEIAPYLFTTNIRVEGKARWSRNRIGEWVMLSFIANDFEVLGDGDLKSDLSRLQSIPAAWKLSDDVPLDLLDIRTGEGQPHGSH